ncbi:MAG: hypothetical protein WCL54_02865 [Clostridia bacterium]
MKKIFALVVAVAMVFGIASIVFADKAGPGPTKPGIVKDCPQKPGDGVNATRPPRPTLDPNATPRPTCPPRPTLDPNATPRPTCPPRPTLDPNATPRPHPVLVFTVFSGTTTAKAFVRVVVGKKVIAQKRADKDGKFSIKVLAKRIKGEAKVVAFVLTKVKKHHMKKVYVDVTLDGPATSEPTPTPEITPEPTPEVTPTSEVTPEPIPEITPEPIL